MSDAKGLLAIHIILVHIFVTGCEHDLVSFTSHLFKNIGIVSNGGMILYAVERT
jgi:hypothetical protein